jgi:hypothetical protein
MWFLFGFITLISFSVYFGIKRLDAKWSGQWAGSGSIPYEYEIVRNKKKTLRFMMGVEGPSGYDFAFKRETWVDRLFKFVGLSIEHQVGSVNFDKLVYVVSNDGHLLTSLSLDSKVQEAVVQLFKLSRYECHVTQVRCTQGRIWATFKVGRLFSTDSDLLRLHKIFPQAAALLQQASTQLKARAPLEQGTQRDRFILRAAAILALSAGLVVNGIAHGVRVLWESGSFTVDIQRLWVYAALCGGGLVAALVLVAIGFLGRSSRAHLVLIELILVGSAGAVLTCFAELRDLNMEMDNSQASSYQVLIQSKSISRSRKGGTHYYLLVPDWNREKDDRRIKVSREFFDSVRVGQQLEVKQRKGYLGLRWVEPIQGAAW